jgi:lipoprotein NlpI
MKSEVKKKLKAAQPLPAKTVEASVPNKKNEHLFIFATLAAYFIIGLIGVFHHEMWRDELQTWLVGASSSGFGEFIHNMKGESNPLLWYTCNFILSRFTDSPVIAQVFHLLISSGSVYLILKYAPFNRLQKVLLSFSYFIFFEYSLLARGYALTIFFIFLFCALYQIKSKNRYLILSLILFFLANTTGVHGVIITLSLLGMMVVDYYFTEDTSIRKKYKPMQLFMGVAVALIGIYIAYKWISPPSDSDRSNQWFTTYNAQRFSFTIRSFWMSLFPVPNRASENFWNSNYFFQINTGQLTFDIMFIVSLAIFFYCVLMYSKKISVAVFYLAATFGVLLLTYSNNTIFLLLAARHYGFIFIAFVTAAWLSAIVKKTTISIPGFNFLRTKFKVEKYFTYLLTGLFAIGVLGSIIAFKKDYTYQFSNIERTGEYIMSHHLDKLPAAGYVDYAISPISAFTKQPIYFPDRDTTGRFTTWGVSRFSFDNNVIFQRLANFISRQHDSVLFISTGDYFGIGNEKVLGNIHFTRLTSFYNSVVPDENYVIYIAKNFDLNKLMNDSNSFRNPEILNSILSSANDLIQGGKLEEAEKILTTVQGKTGGKPVPHLHNYFGMIYSAKNRLQDAEKEFHTEIALNLQKEEAYFSLGVVYFGVKDYDNAIASWDSTLSINPNNTNAYNNIGVCYLNYKKNNATAASYFAKAVSVDPNYVQGYLNLIVCAQNMNNEQDVIKYARILLGKGVTLDAIKAKGVTISDEMLQKINAR